MVTYKYWHRILGMNFKDLEWHQRNISEEFNELQEAQKFIERWSEYADVAFTITRARRDGYDVFRPISQLAFLYGSVYMFPKYTLRWLFFRRAGKRVNPNSRLCEVRNPKKIHKIEHIARKYDINPKKFSDQCQQQLKHWPLLK